MEQTKDLQENLIGIDESLLHEPAKVADENPLMNRFEGAFSKKFLKGNVMLNLLI